MTDSEFDVQARHVERQLGELRLNISAFAKLSAKMGAGDALTKRSVRIASREISATAARIEQDASALSSIERHPKSQTQAQRRLRQHRLVRDLNALRKQFRAIGNTAKLHEHQDALTALSSSLPPGERCTELQGLLEPEGDDDSDLVLVEEGSAIDRGLEQERTRDLNLISSKVIMVHEAFQNLADIAAQQGEHLDDLEACVAGTRSGTQTALQDLQEAAAVASSTRRALCVFVTLVAAVFLYMIAV